MQTPEQMLARLQGIVADREYVTTLDDDDFAALTEAIRRWPLADASGGGGGDSSSHRTIYGPHGRIVGHEPIRQQLTADDMDADVVAIQPLEREWGEGMEIIKPS